MSHTFLTEFARVMIYIWCYIGLYNFPPVTSELTNSAKQSHQTDSSNVNKMHHGISKHRACWLLTRSVEWWVKWCRAGTRHVWEIWQQCTVTSCTLCREVGVGPRGEWLTGELATLRWLTRQTLGAGGRGSDVTTTILGDVTGRYVRQRAGGPGRTPSFSPPSITQPHRYF